MCPAGDYFYGAYSDWLKWIKCFIQIFLHLFPISAFFSIGLWLMSSTAVDSDTVSYVE